MSACTRDDVVFTGNPNGGEMVGELEETGAELLGGSTCADWPPDAVCAAMAREVTPDCGWPHLSASGIFGLTSTFVEMASYILACEGLADPVFRHGNHFDDQKAWREMHRRHFPRLRVDTRRRLFGRFDRTWPEVRQLLSGEAVPADFWNEGGPSRPEPAGELVAQSKSPRMPGPG